MATASNNNEAGFLLDKQTECPVCKTEFKTRAVKSTGVRRIGSDPDLRPLFVGLDSVKYTLSSCPHCGYTAMSRYFAPLNAAQIEYIKDDALPKITPSNEATPATYSYNDSLELYKKALICTVAKKGNISEAAHTFLQTSWLLRGMAKDLIENGGAAENDPRIMKIRQQEDNYYIKSFDAFMKALREEEYPIAGMDEFTFNYLLAQMAFRLKKFDMASKCVSSIVVSRECPNNIREKARDLKDEIVKAIAKQKKEEENS